MRPQNDGQGENNALQNRFTAYLLKAVRNQKANYLARKGKVQEVEISFDTLGNQLESEVVPDMDENLPLIMQLESAALQEALNEIKARERYIFLARVLYERSFEELAGELGMGYKGVTAAYYRVIQKIKKRMGGEN